MKVVPEPGPGTPAGLLAWLYEFLIMRFNVIFQLDIGHILIFYISLSKDDVTPGASAQERHSYFSLSLFLLPFIHMYALYVFNNAVVCFLYLPHSHFPTVIFLYWTFRRAKMTLHLVLQLKEDVHISLSLSLFIYFCCHFPLSFYPLLWRVFLLLSWLSFLTGSRRDTR